ncbi:MULTISPECIES: hypothetical protein [Streptomyces]|uniref:hypothetical protein n=1 Tax=Streptomyces lycopersici TaxID=2974589 RepID=UPI0021D3765B|nr:hypothetical protein [Streptomyces sp. NEAU-383]
MSVHWTAAISVAISGKICSCQVVEISYSSARRGRGVWMPLLDQGVPYSRSLVVGG